MGFCIFNNVAVAARYAQKVHGVDRIAIIDWDIHHGNGTQDIFDADPSIFYFSTHQWPHYPGTGTRHQTGSGAGAGYSLNCPSAPGSGRREVVGSFRHELGPAMEEFRPELVLISAGFDGWVGDSMGAFELSEADYSELTGMLMGIAEKHAGGRLISVLEGGYNMEGLRLCVAAHVAAMQQEV